MQFFASKKRKPESPGLKTGRLEKNAKTRMEGSPSAKGTLDNYLRTSQDNEIMDPPCTTRGMESLVKRNLVTKIDTSSKDKNEQPLPLAELKSQSSEAFEMNCKGISLGSFDAGNVASGGPAEGALQVRENSELEQFATGFLSLYCR